MGEMIKIYRSRKSVLSGMCEFTVVDEHGLKLDNFSMVGKINQLVDKFAAAGVDLSGVEMVDSGHVSVFKYREDVKNYVLEKKL